MKILSTSNEQDASIAPTADQVSRYLQENPDFFVGREHLLLTLELPHQEGQSVSLVQKQMAVLREKNTELRHKLDDLVQNAQRNEVLFGLCRRLTLSLLESQTLGEFLTAIEQSLLVDFRCDQVSLVLTAGRGQTQHRMVHLQPLGRIQEQVASIARSRKPVLGAMRPEELDFLFDGREAGIQSAAAVPLHDDSLIGILAVGSRDPLHFGPDLDTLFLDFMAEVIRKLLPRFS